VRENKTKKIVSFSVANASAGSEEYL